MEKNQASKNKRYNSYIKYTGIAFQMLGAILVTYFIGSKLDVRFGTEPYITAGFTLFGVVAGIYIALKDFIKGE